MLTGKNCDDNTGVPSKADDSLKTGYEHTEKTVPADKSNDADENVIDVD
ncbi:hypothetical protein A2U01_0107999, partial [Trifolium medium]|nr:hypothetical protein [Trifolium medium]